LPDSRGVSLQYTSSWIRYLVPLTYYRYQHLQGYVPIQYPHIYDADSNSIPCSFVVLMVTSDIVFGNPSQRRLCTCPTRTCGTRGRNPPLGYAVERPGVQNSWGTPLFHQ
jgi:hypothetical protein